MGYAIGILLALFICLFARSVGFDRDRAFYPTVLAVVASYYVLFAVMGGSTQALVPVFALTGQEGKLFHPLAFTKTFAVLAATLIAVTFVPVLARCSSGASSTARTPTR